MFRALEILIQELNHYSSAEDMESNIDEIWTKCCKKIRQKFNPSGDYLWKIVTYSVAGILVSKMEQVFGTNQTFGALEETGALLFCSKLNNKFYQAT